MLKVKNRMVGGYRMVVSILVVYPDWDLWLTAAAQHHKRVTYQISLAQENIKVQNLKNSF